MSDAITLERLIEKNRDRHMEDMARAEQKIRDVWEAVELLAAQGFPAEHSSYRGEYHYFEGDVKDLPRLYKALGRVEVSGKQVAWDREKGADSTDTISVSVRPTNPKWRHIIQFTYTKKLGEGAFAPKKCKIVTESSVVTNTRLICNL